MLDRWLDLTQLDPLSLVIGGVLLLFGRRLYWLALGAAGFLLGLLLADQIGGFEGSARLALAVGLAIVGVVAAFLAQRIAVRVGGLVVGAVGLLWLSQPWQAELGPWVWLIALVGAVLGMGFSAYVFDLTLVVLSSWIGAMLVIDAVGVVPGIVPWVFVVLLLLGCWLQTRDRRRPKV